jgi:hypothetical protein
MLKTELLLTNFYRNFNFLISFFLQIAPYLNLSRLKVFCLAWFHSPHINEIGGETMFLKLGLEGIFLVSKTTNLKRNWLFQKVFGEKLQRHLRRYKSHLNGKVLHFPLQLMGSTSPGKKVPVLNLIRYSIHRSFQLLHSLGKLKSIWRIFKEVPASLPRFNFNRGG